MEVRKSEWREKKKQFAKGQFVRVIILEDHALRASVEEPRGSNAYGS